MIEEMMKLTPDAKGTDAARRYIIEVMQKATGANMYENYVRHELAGDFAWNLANHLLAASTASDKQESEPVAWIEHWSGSAPHKGWSIRKGREEVVFLGDNIGGDEVTKIVQAHNGCFDCNGTRCTMNCSGASMIATPSDKQEAVCEHEWEAMTEPHKECVKCGDVRRDWSAAPPAQSAEQDRIDARKGASK